MKKYEFTAEKRSVLESLRQPFAVCQFINKRVVTLLVSDGFCSLFGYTDRREAVCDMENDMYRYTHPDDVARTANAVYRFATEEGGFEVIYRTRMKGGADYFVIHAMGERICTEDGIRLAQIWYTNEGAYVENPAASELEISGSLRNALHEESILRANLYDYLTGLSTMTCFFEMAESEKTAVREEGGQPVLLYIDFSGMKFFNERYGFAEGDKILQAFARLLGGAFGSERSCRIGADHFAVITGQAGLEERLNSIFHEFGKLHGGKTPPVHVGIYLYPPEDVPVSTACDRARLACNTLGASYGSGFACYNAGLSESTILRQYIVENLDTAIREKWIRVYLQPIIRAVNERVCDVEALARWVDPERGILSPASFIPALEETGLIYRLDLYVVDRILEIIRAQKEKGFTVVPHSVNLSRSDFEACDIVEEIRRRVDAAGIEHDRITIEITESIIGKDFAFIKEQVDRFRELGFPVWMDDFGSGYSSMDVLQSIRFDLIKFDMNFMHRLDQGDDGKIVLTNLMRMATSLGVDTVCEGVETKEQVQFLREIGCSKLQGYYYSKPVPFETVLEMRQNKTMIEIENPEEAGYYESIGRVNLFDLGVIGSGGENALQNTFSTIPIAILEIAGSTTKYVRSNRPYRDLVQRFFDFDIFESPDGSGPPETVYGTAFRSAIRQCCGGENHGFFDEKMADGSVIHFFARRVSVNPVTESVAVAIAVLSVTEPDESTTYADIARSLAADYYNIYVIDLDTDDYIEYSSRVGGEELTIMRHGADFFESARRDTMTRIYREDREPFLELFTKENVLRDLDSQGVFTTIYRLVDTGTPVYVNMKITRLHGGNRIILGISIIDAHMRQMEEAKKLRQEKIALGRIAALSPDYIVLYTVDPATGHYTQFNPSSDYENFGLAEQGEDFFADVVLDAPKAIAPEDLERHLHVFTKENVLRRIREDGVFVHYYRLLFAGRSVPVSLKATLVRENGGDIILLGVSNDEEEYSRRLEKAYREASRVATIYTHMAHALARGYTDLLYVNMETGEYIGFNTDDESGLLSEARRGNDFFDSCERDARTLIHPEDQAAFVGAMDREFLETVLEQEKVFELTYRRIKDGKTFYVLMNVSRVEDDRRFIVIAVSDIDELMRKRLMEAEAAMAGKKDSPG